MERLNMAVYDSMAQYVEALVGYITKEWFKEVSAVGFTQEDALFIYLKNKPPDILLAEESLALNLKNTGYDGKVITLYEGIIPQSPDIPGVEKYQPADELMRKVCEIYEPEEEEGLIRGGGLRTDLYTVYSPGQLEVQTPFAATLAMCLARDSDTLYVNLRESAGFYGLLNREFSRDLSDLLFLNTHRNGSFCTILKSNIYEDHELKYLPPMENPSDASGFGKDEWMDFLEKLICESGYDNIVIDLSGSNPVFYEIIKKSTAVYLLTGSNAYEKAQQERFDKNVASRGLGRINDRIHRIRLPTFAGLYASADILSDWIWGDIGDYVREKVLRI